MNGLYSGSTSSHAARSKYGIGESALMTLDRRANGVTPIIGDTSSSRSGRGSPTPVEQVERVLHRQRASVRITHEDERLRGPDTAAHMACAQTDGRDPVLPGGPGQPTGHASMPWHPQRQRVVARALQALGERTHRVRRIGQSVDEERATAHVIWRQFERAVVVARQARRTRHTRRVVAVRRRAVRLCERLLDLAAHLIENRRLVTEILGQRGGIREVGCRHLGGRDQPVPRLQLGMAPACIESATDDERRQDRRRDENQPERPGADPGSHRTSVCGWRGHVRP